MPPSQAYSICERLWRQIDDVRAAARQQEQGGNGHVAQPMYRSCVLLAVASVDTYMHERGIDLLVAHTQQGAHQPTDVGNYCQQSQVNMSGPSARGYIRYGLSFKTLVAPDKIDQLLSLVGVKTDQLWMDVAVAMNSRPDRVRRLLELQYDRRNHVAHEGDWDPSALDFRTVTDTHVGECVDFLRALVSEFERRL